MHLYKVHVHCTRVLLRTNSAISIDLMKSLYCTSYILCYKTMVWEGPERGVVVVGENSYTSPFKNKVGGGKLNLHPPLPNLYMYNMMYSADMHIFQNKLSVL